MNNINSAVSHINKMILSGYPGKMLHNNIKNWTVSVLETNPGIIDQIKEGPYAFYIKSIINDENGYLKDTKQRIAIEKFHGFNGGRSLMITNFKEDNREYIEYDVSKLPNACRDLSDAVKLRFFVDMSDFGSRGSVVGIGFKDGEEKWTIEDGNMHGRIQIKANYKGFVEIPLENCTLKKFDKLLFQVEAHRENINKQVYFSSFASVDGENREKCFFTFEDLALGETNNDSGWEMVVWLNEYSGKMLTGVSLQYMAEPSEELKNFGDRLTEELAEAQYPDGYLGIYKEDSRLGKNQNWDIWGHYHQIYGLISWYRVTGSRQALDTAVKAADCIIEAFYKAGRSMDEFGENQHVNFATTHAFAELYKITNDRKYLDTVLLNVEKQWPNSGNWKNNALKGEDFYKSPLPRWESLHPILTLASLYEITGKKEYFEAFENIRNSINRTDIHITGAFSTYERAQGTTYMSGPIETCCSVAWDAFCSKYLEFSKDSSVADGLELTYFNEIFGSLLDGERLCTYDTPTSGNKRISAASNCYSSPNFFYHSGCREFTCCQANIARGLGEISSWGITTDESGIYINYLGGSVCRTKTPAGNDIEITAKTEYPLNGKISFILSTDKKETFELRIRIPSFAGNAKIYYGGKEIKARSGEYCALSGTWESGDCVTVDFEIDFDYKVNMTDNSLAAIYYGPVLLASAGENAEKYLKETHLSADDIKKIKAEYADDGKHWMHFTLKKDDEILEWYDFASAGKFDAYGTWNKIK